MGQAIWYNDNCDYCYVPIHKNASSWARQFFKKEFEFTEHHMTFDEVRSLDKKYIIFLRDPIQRWVSGVTQWYIQKAKQKYPHIVNTQYKIDPITFEMATEAVGIDAHTHPQTNFISPVRIDRTFFFNVSDKNFANNFQKFLSHKMNYNNSIPYRTNITNPMTLKGSISRQLKSMLTDEYKEKIKSYYQQDISLIEKCKFYSYTESAL